MALHPALRATMKQTMARAAMSTRNSYGEPTYGVAVDFLARFEDVKKLVRTASGEERMSEHRFTTETEINDTDGIWVPGATSGDTQTVRTPLAVMRAVDAAGNFSHCEVYL